MMKKIKISRLSIIHTPFFTTRTLMNGLTESIAKQGLLVPLTVRKAPKKWWQWPQRYQIIDGVASLIACKELGYKKILCDVLSVTDEQLIQARIIASHKEVATSPEQYAKAIKILMNRTGMTLSEIAAKFGKPIEELQDVLKHATEDRSIHPG